MAFHSIIRKEVSIVLLIIIVKLARLSTFELTVAKLTVVMVLDLLNSVEVEVEEEARQRSESIDYHQLQFIVTILPL